jgi:hypothetical protein
VQESGVVGEVSADVQGLARSGPSQSRLVKRNDARNQDTPPVTAGQVENVTLIGKTLVSTSVENEIHNLSCRPVI